MSGMTEAAITLILGIVMRILWGSKAALPIESFGLVLLVINFRSVLESVKRKSNLLYPALALQVSILHEFAA